ncbi:tetratricopeptide repeat protein, partial [Rubrivirga sp.]|uniref:tetratricopeptide repeat protein n=1 Tax=Rubrivirga sp. TaxID=1885344 RepID=UPI003C70995B
AEAFAADLDRWLRDEPIDARLPSTGERMRRFVRKHRTSVAAAALVAIAILGGAVSTLLQARETRLEADRSQATADFLADIFHESNPATADAPRSTLDLIGRGAQRIEAELAGQPDLQARLLAVVADAYLGQGRPDSAEAMARRALAIRQPGGTAPDPAEAVRAEILLGRAAFIASPERGGPLLDRAVENARTVDDDVLLAALDAQVRLAAGREMNPQQTVTAVEEAVALSRRIDGEGSPRLGRLLTLLGSRVSMIHQHGRMEPLFRESLANLPASQAPYDRSVALVSLSELLGMTGQRDEAWQHANEALALRRRVLPTGDARIAEALATRAAVEDDDLEAERDVRAAVRIAEQADDAPLLVEVVSLLRDVLSSQERYDEAVEASARHVALAKEVYGPGSTRYPSSVGAYGRVLHQAGRYGDAAEVWEQAIPLSIEAYGPESAVIIGVYVWAGQTAQARERLDQAESYYSRAFEASADLPESSKNRAYAGLWLGELRLKLNRAEDALGPLQQATAGREALNRPGHRSMAADGHYAAALLGEALLATGQRDRGQQLLDQAIPELASALGEDAPKVIRARAALTRGR